MRSELSNDQLAEDRTDELAAALGWPIETFTAILGAGWTESIGSVSHDCDRDPSGGEDFPVTRWMITGHPAQLMVWVFDHGSSWHVPRAISPTASTCSTARISRSTSTAHPRVGGT